MDKRIVGLLGAAAALTTVTGANAAVAVQTAPAAAPASYQELLNPIANPVAALKADDARKADEAAGRGIEVAQGPFYHHHHHHHHHHHGRRHHHHHHHHHNYMG